jgi:transcription initiation factor TFIIIB Brf1 subunit/transcription initiation factor TFIIB
MSLLFPGFCAGPKGLQAHTQTSSSFDAYLQAAAEAERDSSPLGSTAITVACPSCKIPREDWTFDDLNVCGTCGVIMERPIDSGAEYRFFSSEERGGGDPCRVGAPMDTRFPTSGLGTMILSHAQGGNSSTRMAMARVRRYHTWNLLPYRERSLLQIFEQIALAATNHGFDVRTMDIAKDMYVKLVEHCDRRGMSRTSVVASSIYSALKQVGQPRKPKEIADMFHLSTAQFTKSLKYFQEILCMAHQRGLLEKNQADPAAMPSTRASDYISNPLSKLPVARSTFQVLREIAIRVADEVEDKEICPENMPPSLAAGVIALVLQHMKASDPISHGCIASVCGVSEGTIQKCLKKLETAAATGEIVSLVTAVAAIKDQNPMPK